MGRVVSVDLTTDSFGKVCWCVVPPRTTSWGATYGVARKGENQGELAKLVQQE